MENKDIILKIENVCKNYGDLEVLKGINYEIKRGEVVSNRGQRGRINDDNVLFAGNIDAACWVYRSNTQIIYAVHIGSICPIN